MKDLRQARRGWDAADSHKTEMLRRLTIREGVAQYLALQREFEPLLQETESWYRAPRLQALADLQSRLLRLNLVTGNGGSMESLLHSVAYTQHLFEQAGLPSAVIGGLAVSIWGEPRLTRDADLKVLAQREGRAQVLQVLAGFTTLHADPDEALRRQGIAFFHDPAGTRINIMLAETSFDESVIGRAEPLEVQPGMVVRVCRAEDLIVYKLVSLRTQDHADVEGIVRRQGDQLDDTYVEKWLRLFEQALDDSTLLAQYRELRRRIH